VLYQRKLFDLMKGYIKMLFKYFFEVNGYELDSFGHVNNAVYLNYYEQARWKIMQDLDLLTFFQNSSSFLVVIKAELKYIKELKLLDKATVETSFKTEGFFVVFKQNIYNEKNEKVNQAVIKCLLVNKEREPMDIPQEILNRGKYD